MLRLAEKEFFANLKWVRPGYEATLRVRTLPPSARAAWPLEY